MTGTSRPSAVPGASLETLAKAFSLSPTVITLTSLANGRFLEVNDSFIRLSGFSREETIGKTPIELGLWVNPALRTAALEQIRAREVVEHREMSFRTKAGAILTCIVSADLVVREGEPCVMSVIADISDRKKAEQELEQSKRLFQQILEATPDIVYIYDVAEWKVVYTNRGVDQLGYSRESLQQLDLSGFRNLFHPDEADRVMAEIASRVDLTENEIAESEFRARHADGSWRWLRRRDAAFLRNADGRVTQFVGVARDITAAKEQDDLVRASEERLRLATQAGGVGTYDVALDTDEAKWTPRLLEIYGLPPDAEVSRATLRGMVHPDDQDRVQVEFERVTRVGGEHEIEHRIVRPSGEIRWVIARGRVLLDAGRPVRALGAIVDITDRNQTEQSLRTSEMLFRSLADTAPSMIWTAGPDGTITFQNQQWLRYTGLSAHPAVTDWARLVLHPDDHDRAVAEWNRCLTEGVDYENEARSRRFDGTYRWFLTRATPVRDRDGRVSGWFGSTTDIHEKKQSEEARERLLAELESLDRRKDQFLAMLSHELRNPLAPIRNAVHLLRIEPAGTPASTWAHEVIDRQVDHLSHLIDDLLDVSRIASGKVRLEREPVEFSSVISAALEASRPLVEGRKHQLTVAYPTEPVWLEGDSVRLTQVLTNLLNNAAKYTEEGGQIWLTTKCVGRILVVSVRDDGIGIAPELLPQVFDLFTQADRSLERAEGGLGVGLSLVRSLVELHGGTVQATSGGSNHGSEFVIRLPTIDPPPKLRRSLPDLTFAGKRPARILVVDDNRDLADSTALLLELSGHEVALAFDGPSAIEQARAFRPSVVLLDVGLPGMDGYTVARTLRQDPGVAAVLIALTGYGTADDRARSKEAGFDHHLVKPVDFSSLEQLLHRTLI